MRERALDINMLICILIFSLLLDARFCSFRQRSCRRRFRQRAIFVVVIASLCLISFQLAYDIVISIYAMLYLPPATA